MSRFACIPGAAPVEIFALNKAYKEDSFEQKVDLGIGAYRSDEGKPWVLPVVRKAELAIASDESLNHEYLGQFGDETFCKLSSELLLGADNEALKSGRVVACQALSGTGALRLGVDFLHKCAGFKTLYSSKPTWPNHMLLAKHAGIEDVRSYRYWDAAGRKLDFDGMMEDLKAAPEDSVILLHTCAHNPTGVDATQEQWSKIADLMAERKLFPFFDCAYQGFASGDTDADAASVRYFVSRGFELLCAQSYAKNFGLYNERIGNLNIVVKDVSTIANIRAQVTLLVRGNVSNPPAHGARIVKMVLGDEKLRSEWQGNIKTMATRIITMRKALREKIEELKTPGDWSHITSQIGMFSYTGLNEKQVEFLVKERHIYLPKSARISLCGLNTKNVEYVAKAINEAVNQFPN